DDRLADVCREPAADRVRADGKTVSEKSKKSTTRLQPFLRSRYLPRVRRLSVSNTPAGDGVLPATALTRKGGLPCGSHSYPRFCCGPYSARLPVRPKAARIGPAAASSTGLKKGSSSTSRASSRRTSSAARPRPAAKTYCS